MKFTKKTKISSEIPTASMPDIIFMLLVFFMVTTVLKEYSGLPVNLPKAKRIEKLKSKRHTVQVWVSKEGLISIDDRLMGVDDVSLVMYDKRIADPQIVVSLKGDEDAEMNAAFQNQWMWGAGYRIAGGTDEILRNIVSEQVLGLPQDIRVDKKVPFNELPGSGRK